MVTIILTSAPNYAKIEAGIESNVDTVLVLSGVTAEEDIASFPYRPKYVLPNVGALLKD